jgi:hypothetical protein
MRIAITEPARARKWERSALPRVWSAATRRRFRQPGTTGTILFIVGRWGCGRAWLISPPDGNASVVAFHLRETSRVACLA